MIKTRTQETGQEIQSQFCPRVQITYYNGKFFPELTPEKPDPWLPLLAEKTLC